MIRDVKLCDLEKGDIIVSLVGDDYPGEPDWAPEGMFPMLVISPVMSLSHSPHDTVGFDAIRANGQTEEFSWHLKRAFNIFRR